MRACVIGSTNVDLVLEVPSLPRPGETLLSYGSHRHAGGKGANQASALARLGADVALVSAVGADRDGEWSLAQLAGTDTSAVAVLAGVATGLAVVMVDPAGENSIVVTPGANAEVALPERFFADVVLVSLEIPLHVATAAAARARAAGIRVILNAAPATALPDELLAAVDVLIVNEHELLAVGSSTSELLNAGVGAVVITLGAQGCVVVQANGETRLPSVPVDVVDTTGAGDCFAAAFAYGVGSGWSLGRCARLANAAAALSVTKPGARGGQPTLADALALVPEA